jgi:membrane protein implicated in regulation of membrane protease activity
MNWETFYLACFGIGLALSVLSFAGGIGHLHLGHLHLGHTHAGHGHAHAPSPFNLFTAMAFLSWFGGAGYLLTHYGAGVVPLIFLLAVLAGLAGAAVVFLFLAKVLLPHERTLLPEDTEMRGVIARVSSPLRPGGTGEILFSLNGTRRSAAARTSATSDGPQPIPIDAQVLVERYEQGIAYVRPFTELDEFDAPHTPT